MKAVGDSLVGVFESQFQVLECDSTFCVLTDFVTNYNFKEVKEVVACEALRRF